MTRFVEQAYLLWMQRNDNEWDLVEYMAECKLTVLPSKRQMSVVTAFRELHKGRT